MNAAEAISSIENVQTDTLTGSLYGLNNQETQKQRIITLLKKIACVNPQQDVYILSTPGRTELSGNHTDHNHGKVLVASINLDIIAAIVKSKNNKIILDSEGFAKPFNVNLSSLKPRHREQGKTESLIRGAARYLKDNVFNIGRFTGFMHSNLPYE